VGSATAGLPAEALTSLSPAYLPLRVSPSLSDPDPRMPVRTGAEVLLGDSSLRPGGRVGLLTHDAARVGEPAGPSSRVAMVEAGLDIVRLFSPEHGIAASAADGEAVADAQDPHTGLPIVSLYGAHFEPEPTALAGLDAVLVDLQDVGARFYTYIWTLSHLIDACAEAGVPVVVLDRPNPLGGRPEDAEGPLLDEAAFGSFLGRLSMPVRHCLTIAEFGRLWAAERRPGAEVHVVPAEGWRRAMHWPATGRSFVPPSPAMPAYECALFYPGTCLFEGTNLSVGRGSLAPFRTVGAPWLRPDAVLERLGPLEEFRALAQPARFIPDTGPGAGESCRGLLLSAGRAEEVRPVALGLLLMAAIAATHPADFRWHPYPTAANPSGEGHFERLVGRRGIREVIETAPDELTQERVTEWTAAPGWTGRLDSVRLYD
jgi:uncharacterized protein YbbC (DUF1343 family)